MKIRSAVVGALALAITMATLGGSTAGAIVSPTSASTVTPTQQLTSTKAAKAVRGDFDGDGRDDIFWYVAGSGADYLWSGKARVDTTEATTADRFTVQPLNISGTYEPIAGDFDGDGRDDIFWYAKGSAPDSIWYFTGRGTLTSKNISISGTYVPYVGNFDKTTTSASTDDIFWYSANGVSSSSMWTASSNQTFAGTVYPTKPPANAKVYAGNWRQNPTTFGSPVHQDLLFYVPGTGTDQVWVGNGTSAFTTSPVTINGKYDPIVGNFDSDSGPVMTDIFWYAPGAAADSVWMNNGAGFVSIPQKVTGLTYKPVVLKAQGVEDDTDDILWNNPSGADFIWKTTGAARTFTYTDVKPGISFGAADVGTRTPLVGDFNAGDAATTKVDGRIGTADDHTCALTSGGGVECWGLNHLGQLGDGTTANSATPVDVPGLSSGISAVVGGSNFSCALTTGGTVKCWGVNSYGQLGNNTTTTSNTPVDVSGITGASAIAAGSTHACAVTSTGVKCWGRNDTGQLGNNTTTNASTPVTVSGLSGTTTSITAGFGHTCAIDAVGTKCWGRNDSGQVGNNTTTNALTATAVNSAGNGAVTVSAGYGFTCSLNSASAVKCWGSSSAGQVGNGLLTNALIPTQVTGLTTGVSLLTTGQSHACARLTDGSTKCWGLNSSGQLGNGTTTNSSTPVTTSVTIPNVVAITAGWAHTCTIDTTGAVKCWGSNASSQLGNATGGNATAPTNAAVGVNFNTDTQTVTPSVDVLWWAPGDEETKTEQLWYELGSLG